MEDHSPVAAAAHTSRSAAAFTRGAPLAQLQRWCCPVDGGIEDSERGDTVQIRRLAAAPAAGPLLPRPTSPVCGTPKFYH
jgi:hypothetical protein